MQPRKKTDDPAKAGPPQPKKPDDPPKDEPLAESGPPQRSVAFPGGKLGKNELLFDEYSRLVVKADKEDYEYFKKLTMEPPSGYTPERSIKALKKFEKRGLLTINLTKRTLENKLVSFAGEEDEKRFSYADKDLDTADQNCALRVIKYLYRKDIVKEYNYEFNPRRKEILDPLSILDALVSHELSCMNPADFTKLLKDLKASCRVGS